MQKRFEIVDMINARQDSKDKFELWYGTHKYRTKSLEQYIFFLKNLLDEILLCLAHVCKDIRKLENRE